jgi:Spy/CpxP family protein refolding chaperone
MTLADPGQNSGRVIAAPRLTTVVLILSLALNVFVAGGFFYSRFEAAHQPPVQPQQQPAHRLEALARQIGIDPQNSPPFNEMRHDFWTMQRMLGAKNQPLSEAYWQELSKPQPDQKKLQDLVDQLIANRHSFQSEVTGILARFMATLTAEQRAELVKVMEDKKNPLGAPVRNSLGN